MYKIVNENKGVVIEETEEEASVHRAADEARKSGDTIDVYKKFCSVVPLKTGDGKVGGLVVKNSKGEVLVSHKF